MDGAGEVPTSNTPSDSFVKISQAEAAISPPVAVMSMNPPWTMLGPPLTAALVKLPGGTARN